MSEKLLNDIRNLQFVDFNSLLPNALYDPMVGTEDLLLAVNQLDSGAPLLSVQPARQQKRKINNSAAWLEAWNVYIRVMAHFHPHLIPDLLVYQDFMCALQRSYPTQSWLRYDTAFRLHLALDKTVSWAIIDEHAFNKFVRCAILQKKISCFICSSEDHLANACPRRSFRPKTEPTPFPNGQQRASSTGTPCKFYNAPKATCD